MEGSHLGSKVSENDGKATEGTTGRCSTFQGVEWGVTWIDIDILFDLQLYYHIFCRLHSAVYELCDL